MSCVYLVSTFFFPIINISELFLIYRNEIAPQRVRHSTNWRHVLTNTQQIQKNRHFGTIWLLETWALLTMLIFLFFFSHSSTIVTNFTHLHENWLWTWAHYIKLSSRHVHFHRCSTIYADDNWKRVCHGNVEHHPGWCRQCWHRDWN